MFQFRRIFFTAIVIGLGMAQSSDAQRVRLSTPTALPAAPTTAQGGTVNTGAAPPLSGTATRMTPIVQPNTNTSGFTTQSNFTPQGQVPFTPTVPNQGLQTQPFGTVAPNTGVPTATIQQPSFDAFATQQGIGQPAVIPAPNGNLGTYAPGQLQVYPPANAQPVYVPNQVAPGYPQYTGQPNSLFPGWKPSGIAWPYSPNAQGQYLRLFENRRLEYTWINGDGGSDVDINDVLIGVTMNYPDFLTSNQPLKISPAFIFHFWGGPAPPEPRADLPSKAYSAFVEFDWMTRQDVQFGGEVNFGIGVYSDFQSVTTDAIRLTGTGLGWLRITPNLTMKAGVEYLDRLDVKLFPAIGLFWEPNPDLKLDLYFPRPRIARRLPQLGNTEIWMYLAAEYGGGSWVIERADSTSDQVDINDIRVFGGFEFTTLTAVNGFFEVGYVFDRELVYRNNGLDNTGLPDTFMLRTGFGF